MKSLLATLAATSIGLTSGISTVATSSHIVAPQGETYNYYWNQDGTDECICGTLPSPPTEGIYLPLSINLLNLTEASSNKITNIEQITDIQIKSTNKIEAPKIEWENNINNSDPFSVPVDEAFNSSSLSEKISGDWAKGYYAGAQYELMDWTLTNSQGVQLHAIFKFGFSLKEEDNGVILLSWVAMMAQISESSTNNWFISIPLGQRIQFDIK